MARQIPFLIALTALSAVFLHAEYRINSPSPFAIVRTNWLKLQVISGETDPRPDSIVYQITYPDPRTKSDSLLNVSTAYPFEYLYDLKDMHDMFMTIRALAYAHGSAETLGLEYGSGGIPIALDRTMVGSPMTMVSSYWSGRTGAGAYLESNLKPMFESQNNNVQCASAWNSDSLYFMVRVADANVMTVAETTEAFGKEKDYFRVLWTSDGIELCFDVHRNRTEWKELDDFEMLVNVTGAYQGNVWDQKEHTLLHWGNGCRVAVTVSGTVNKNDDIDTGYTVFIAIPFSGLKYKPVPDDILGFDAQLFDLDTEHGTVFRTIWSNSEQSNNDNPSEWGSLVLAGKGMSGTRRAVLGVTAGIFLFICAFFFLRNKKKKPIAEYSPAIIKAIQYIRENYKNDIFLKDIAGASGFSKAYFSAMFRNETGQAVIEYLFEVRIENACRMLKETTESVTQIGYAVGFKDQSHFTKVFKKKKGVTPNQYRESNPQT